MKRFAVSLIATVLAFTAGLVTASSWNNERKTAQPVLVRTAEPCAPISPQPPAPVKSFTVTPPREFYFGQKGLKLVSEQVHLKSESLGYDIDVSYPQIFGTAYRDPAKIRKVNQHLKESITNLYQWPLNPAAPERRASQAQLGIRDAVNFTYHVGLATDSLLSVQFIGYSFDGLNSSQVEDSFTLNYDLASGKRLTLSDIFKPGSKYLEFISRYCIDELSRGTTRKLNLKKLAPAAENFERWQISTNGIMFNFHSCKVADCSESDIEVEIPFDDLKPLLNPGIPSKFNITYP